MQKSSCLVLFSFALIYNFSLVGSASVTKTALEGTLVNIRTIVEQFSGSQSAQLSRLFARLDSLPVTTHDEVLELCAIANILRQSWDPRLMTFASKAIDKILSIENPTLLISVIRDHNENSWALKKILLRDIVEVVLQSPDCTPANIEALLLLAGENPNTYDLFTPLAEKMLTFDNATYWELTRLMFTRYAADEKLHSLFPRVIEKILAYKDLKPSELFRLIYSLEVPNGSKDLFSGTPFPYRETSELEILQVCRKNTLKKLEALIPIMTIKDLRSLLEWSRHLYLDQHYAQESMFLVFLPSIIPQVLFHENLQLNDLLEVLTWLELIPGGRTAQYFPLIAKKILENNDLEQWALGILIDDKYVNKNKDMESLIPAIVERILSLKNYNLEKLITYEFCRTLNQVKISLFPDLVARLAKEKGVEAVKKMLFQDIHRFSEEEIKSINPSLLKEVFQS